jgi:curved DNA-binding protein CbpA
MNPDPFGVLGLPARPGLTDDDVRAAWRRVAAATHPDRADGGDPGRFAEAAAAYTQLRTRYGRGEAYADLARGTRQHSPADTRQRPQADSRPYPPTRSAAAHLRALAARIRRGRPAVLILRLAVAAGVIAVAFLAVGTQPAAAGLATGAVTWLLLTARHDLIPPS